MIFSTQQDRDYAADDRDRLWGAWPVSGGPVRIPMSNQQTMPSIADLTSKEQEERGYPLIREWAARALTPGPWEHHWKALPNDTSECRRCGRNIVGSWIEARHCPIPDPMPDDMAVIAERLVKHVLIDGKLFHAELGNAIKEACPLEWPYADDALIPAMSRWIWFGVASTPAEKAAIALHAIAGKGATESGRTET